METNIPKGVNCYEIIDVDVKNDEMVLDICPYWVKTENGAKCLFLNIECEDYNSEFDIWKQKKECNVNLYDNVKECDFYFEF